MPPQYRPGPDDQAVSCELWHAVPPHLALKPSGTVVQPSTLMSGGSALLSLAA